MEKSFSLNTELAGQLRNKVNEHIHLITLIDLKSINKKDKPSETKAWFCICAIMDRVDDSSHYLIENQPKSKFNDRFDAFKFYNFLNISASMLDCIDKLSDIFNIDRSIIDSETDCFHQLGNDGKGSDKKYFEYIRSICSVHPTETDRHHRYQDGELEWCPYVSVHTLVHDLLQPNEEIPDLVATVYTSANSFNKYINLYFVEIFKYINKRFDFIAEIIKGINSYYNRKINEFRAIHIPLQSECTDYNDYLSKIREAAIARCGAESGDSIRYVARALRVVLNNNDTQHKLISDYQDALRISIENYREALQKMVYRDESRDEITDDYYETLLYPHSLGKSVPLDNYSYQLEKLLYLNTAVYADDMTTDLVDDFNEEKVRLGIRDCYALMKKRDKLGNEFHLYLSALDGKYHFNNSEWARIQVRILIPLLKPYMNTPDIFLKNIELYTLLNATFYEIRQENKKR